MQNVLIIATKITIEERFAALELRVKELEDENASLGSIIKMKDAKIAELETKVKELTERLNKNSSNSHKPPSSEGYSKKPAFAKHKGGKPS